MGKHQLLELLLLLAFLLQHVVTPASAQCNVVGFAACADLPPASTLAWTFSQSNNTVSIAYSDTALSGSGWVGWGINFDGTAMVGTNAFIAFTDSNGSSTVLLYKLTTTDVSTPLNPVSSFDQLQVLNLSTQILGTTFTIFATLQLSAGQTTLNHVYNRGPSVSNNSVPSYHSSSPRNGMQTVDMLSNSVTASEPPNQKLKNAHGTLAVVSWGLLLILGVMSARYLRPFSFADPAWFYMHILFQCTGYILGVTAWGMGLRLGTLSQGVEQSGHRSIGIAIFTFGTLQIFALFLRPNKEHKFRLYWNVYHHGIGYMVIILSVINIFKGFDILTPPNGYKVAYVSFIVVVACISVALEAVTWFHFFQKRKGKRALNGRSNSNRSFSNRVHAATSHPKPKLDAEV